MSKLKIGLDFDGVVSDAGRLKSDAAKKIFNKDIPPALFKRELVVKPDFLTNDQYNELQNLVYGTREYGFMMQPVMGMLEHLPKLIEHGHDVKIITSRNEDWAQIAREWLDTHNIKIKIIGVGNGISKLEAAKGLDIYIDDDLEKLLPLVGTVPYLFLFSWDYNKHIGIEEGIERISSWNEFSEKITNIIKTS